MAFLGLLGVIAILVVVITEQDKSTQQAVGVWLGILPLAAILAYLLSRLTKHRD